MKKAKRFPDYIFESSWEVCNKVGGIYTVLSTRAKTLQSVIQDKLIFIGPDLNDKQDFTESKDLYEDWVEEARKGGLQVRVGRWEIPGRPVAILVDFTPYYTIKNEIYAKLWDLYQVDSLHAYGDYDEASMFSYAAALVVESFYAYYAGPTDRVVYQANEWMMGLSLLHVRHHCPRIATVFTTHATTIGRSIAGNHKPLYEYLPVYNGDRMATELNVQSKHFVEKQAAWFADCFTTVSDITALECRELLDKPVDVVLPNGFEDSFVPKGSGLTAKRRIARKKLLAVANKLTGAELPEDKTLIVSTAGRYEFRNKGIDVFIDAVSRLRFDENLKKKIVAFIEVPAWVSEPRKDLQERCKTGRIFDTPLESPFITHWLYNWDDDNVLSMLRALNMENKKDDEVFIIFVPCYLNGNDGIFNMSYYDLVSGNDLCVYPSYYEPWGYTPLESVAFGVPCITTDLAGFGLWAQTKFVRYKNPDSIVNGVKVIHRTDENYHFVADEIKNTITAYTSYNKEEISKAKKNARLLSKEALWSNFIGFYYQAYDIAFAKMKERLRD